MFNGYSYVKYVEHASRHLYIYGIGCRFEELFVTFYVGSPAPSVSYM